MSTNFTINTDRIDALIEELDAAMFRLTTSTPVEVDGSGKGRHNDSRKAAVSRDLLRAADVAAHIESELRQTYWRFKGLPYDTDIDTVGSNA